MSTSAGLKLAVLFGGPSLERGISLNSARSLYDHLHADNIEIVPVYFRNEHEAYHISVFQIYSNTPADFDFKLDQIASPLDSQALAGLLKSVDLVFPAIHGRFGEDGHLQKFLEEVGCPFVGSPSDSCKSAFDKAIAGKVLKEAGYHSIPNLLLESNGDPFNQSIRDFFEHHNLAKAVVKPARSGSSIGVYVVASPQEALLRTQEIIAQKIDSRVIIEPFCEGKEFTVIVLENKDGKATALCPAEIEIDTQGQDQDTDINFFDYRNKYLSNGQVRYHCPPRFADSVVEQIRSQAAEIFALFHMRDFARFDGWLLSDGRILFSDLNPISGMEQNSFLFIQGAQIGMSHHDLLRYILKNACRRHRIELAPYKGGDYKLRKQKVNVLFGGDTAERHVSLMSGTNVWLKLRQSQKYDPYPYLLDKEGHVWRMPYALCLYHTVEEISELCRCAPQNEIRVNTFRQRILKDLALLPAEAGQECFLPEAMSLPDFIKSAPNVFIALHGGLGENGKLQEQLEELKVPYTGSGPEASRLCMNKFATGMAIQDLEPYGVFCANKQVLASSSLLDKEDGELIKTWQNLLAALETQKSSSVIVKPLDDGCSAGVARLSSAQDFIKYIQYLRAGAVRIPDKILSDQHGIIELPSKAPEQLLFENFVKTREIIINKSNLAWDETTEDTPGWRLLWE